MTDRNPVEYAEDILDVHGVFREAKDRLERHEDAKNLYVTTLAQIRSLKSEIQSVEIDVTAEERGDNPDMKVTAFREHLKNVFESHLGLRDLRSNLAAAESARDEAKADMDHHALGVGALTARMSELAGLLQFYSAAKLATLAQPTIALAK